MGHEAGSLACLHAKIDRDVLRPDFLGSFPDSSSTLGKVWLLHGTLWKKTSACGDTIVGRERRIDPGGRDQLIGDRARREHQSHAGREQCECQSASLWWRKGLDRREHRGLAPAILHHAAIGTEQRHAAHDRIVSGLERGELDTTVRMIARREIMRAAMHVLGMVGVSEILGVDLPVPRQRRVSNLWGYRCETRVLIA